MTNSSDKRGSASGDMKQNGTGDDAAAADDAEQPEDAPAPAPDERPRRPRLYGYDPDLWPELG